MRWDEMCLGQLTTGTNVDLNTLYGFAADAVRLTRAALPPAPTLKKMADKAQGLKLKATDQGIWFNIHTCGISGDNLTTSELYNNSVIGKAGAAVCYENRLLPLQIDAGTNLLVHQGLAPCKRCRTGYKAWAQAKACTIIVYADNAYDGAPDGSLFVFSPSGDVFYG